VLQLLTLLSEHPEGLRAAAVAEAVGKSPSTAYNLLDTLCQEGFAVHEGGVYRLTTDAAELTGVGHELRASAGLEGIVDELFARTHKRVYLAVARSGEVVMPLVRGRQGMPRIPGLGPHIRENAHALALGKIALSLLDEVALARYVDRGLRRFTPATIVDPDVLRAQLDAIRAGAVAYDVEEIAADFCCLAVPVRNARGQAVAALGISMSARCFVLERETLERELAAVSARASEVLRPSLVPAISEETRVLERGRGAVIRSAPSAVATAATAHPGEKARR
jgi:DNA-binding IclR family transcriptional regulator